MPTPIKKKTICYTVCWLKFKKKQRPTFKKLMEKMYVTAQVLILKSGTIKSYTHRVKTNV